MSSLKQSDGSEVGVDAKNLYQEETFTDLKVATIKRLSPVQADGSPDPDRKAMFIGQSTIVVYLKDVVLARPPQIRIDYEHVTKCYSSTRLDFKRPCATK